MFAVMRNNKTTCEDHEDLKMKDLNVYMYDEYVVIELDDVFELSKTDGQINQASVQNEQHALDLEIQHTQLELETFLKQLKRKVKKDFIKHMESTIEHVYHCSNRNKSWLEMADHIQDFYEGMPHRISTNKLYKGVSAELSEILMDRAEKYMMAKMYSSTFCPPNTDDRKKDLNLQAKIQNLHWIVPRHLNVPINDQDPQVRSLFDQAVAEIIKINSRKTPQGKLSSIRQGMQYIVEMVKLSKSRMSSADDLVPSADDLVSSLIYVIIKVNPPNLKSNVQYLIRFANHARLGTGELAYCFTNMVGAVAFIENLSIKSLNLTRQEYDQYTSKEDLFSHAANMFISEDLRLKYENLKTLAELQQRHDKIMSEALRLQQDMKKFKESFKQEVENTSRTHHKVQPVEMEVQIDSDSDGLLYSMVLEPPVTQALSEVPGISVQNDVESVAITQALSVVAVNNVQNDVESVAVTQALSVVPENNAQNDVESFAVTQALSVVAGNNVQNDVESVAVILAQLIVPDNNVQNDVELAAVTQALSEVAGNNVQNDVELAAVTQALSEVAVNNVQNDVESVAVTQALSEVAGNNVQNDVELAAVTQALSEVAGNNVQNDVELAAVTQALSEVAGNNVENDVELAAFTQAQSEVAVNNVQNDVESVAVTQALSVVAGNNVQNDVELAAVTQALSEVAGRSVENDVEFVVVTQALSEVPGNNVQIHAELASE